MSFLENKSVYRLAAFFVVLLFSSSSFAVNIGDTVNLLVPDVSYFPDTLRLRQFTCRAITENAIFLVQDTSFIDLPNSMFKFQVIWDNVIGEAEIDSIAAQFDGAGVDVYETVTSIFGEVPLTVNNDDKVWIVMADVPDYYPVPGSPIFVRLQTMVYTWPDDFDGNQTTGNNHDCFYVNIGAYKNVSGAGGQWEQIRGSIRTWSVATGFGQFLRIANNRFEDKWALRGLGLFSQYMCYGLTTEYGNRLGIRAYLKDFSRGGGIELAAWSSGQPGRDFGVNQGGEFLWFKYLEQRFGEDVITSIISSSGIGMLAIANSIDSSVPDSIAEGTLIYPLYEEWLITNLVSHIAGNYAGGIYRYAFLDGTGYSFTMIDSPASFIEEFDSYPFPTWIANPYYGVSAQVFAAQYVDFQGDYALSGDTTVFFNGMFNQNSGSGSNLNGQWTIYKIILSDDSTLQSVDSLHFNEYYNGTFSLEDFRTCLVLTNNNPGGTARIRYVLSQETVPKSLFLAALQNGINHHYLQVYCSLLRQDDNSPYGFDWIGPELELSKLNSDGSADSTAIVSMDFLSGTLWTGQAKAWSAGNYNLGCSGFDSLGNVYEDSILFGVGYGGEGKIEIDIETARLEISAGVLPEGEMASLIQANELGVSLSSSFLFGSAGSILTGIIAGPVSLSFNHGLISFPAETAEGAIFWLSGDTWLELDTYFLAGRMYAIVTEAGIFVLGDRPGLLSPEISLFPVFNGSSPNPFSSLVSFQFSLPQAGEVSLVVYDVSGRIVKSVKDGYLSSGLHTLSWSGKDDSGNQIPPGVYFARFSTLEYSETVKLLRVHSGDL